jgi:cobalt-zinc-cadmium efflux system membrane fusion protein
MPELAGRRDVKDEAMPESQQTAVSGLKGLSRGAQIAVLMALAVLLAVDVVTGPSLYHPTVDRAADAAVESDGHFRPTTRQWDTLTISPVREWTFRAVQETEGKIANDDDLTTQVFSPFSGRVIKLFAKAGDYVKVGDPLLVVQAAELVQAVNDLVSAASSLTTARAQLNLAQSNEKRQHALYEAQGAALKDWQQSQVDLANAQGGQRSAEIALGAVRNRLRILGKSDPEIETIANTPDPSRFSPEAFVVAPIDGTVLQRQIGLGQYIVSQSSGGSSAVFSVGDLSKVWLLANVREIDAPMVHLGEPLEVRVLAYPNRMFRARITYIAPSIDSTTHRLPVRAEIDNVDGALKPEMFARFSIATGPEMSAPAVPDSAVVHEGSAAHVWVARTEDKTIAIRQVRTGLIADGFVQISEGLRLGEMVVTRGSLFIDRATAGD